MKNTYSQHSFIEIIKKNDLIIFLIIRNSCKKCIETK